MDNKRSVDVFGVNILVKDVDNAKCTAALVAGRRCQSNSRGKNARDPTLKAPNLSAH